MSEAVPQQAQPSTQTDADSTQSSLPQSKTNLEGMFDDDGSDDEFSSSAPQKSSQTVPQAISASDPDTLLSFYSRLFPFRSLFQWLNASPTPSPQFTNREFAFVLPNDAYIRYQSFPTADALRKQCLQMTPVRFEIGPQYSLNPRDRKTVRKQGAFRPVAKELVFDIDMTDYDEIRTCCSKAQICPKCWEYMTAAIKVLDRALREDFGFKHLLWVYSGRRGVHCWVSDRRARQMDDATRRSVAGYMEVLRGGQKKVSLRRPLHPHIERSLTLLNPHFSSLLSSQDPFLTPAQSTRLLSLIPDSTLTSALEKKWASTPSRPSAQKWNDIDALASSGSLSITPRALADAKQDIRLEHTYPRLDAEVSKKLNHLLKSPFVVHPGTGRVCVPIDPSKAEEFDPFSVPTVQQLLGEIDDWQQEDGGEAKEVQDWQKTSLRPYVEYFKRFVDGLVKDEMVEKKRGREEEGAGGLEF
ncbi:prim-pol domain-containing protein [Myriangium duriaei CBS 260.36]|uniref:DNA primase n=1 Tax=Myriangium duriaei CBS 260.36 TaxID=1168546 RepID=A0A9P4IZE7_9PEZI|nr:prim-pol domain-containing protein [Myriangium duriaei CBS 260.36]